MKKWTAILALLLVVAMIVPVAAAPAYSADGKTDVYIVQMSGAPVVAFEGGIKGLKATKPEKDKKINPNSAAVKKYTAHLDSQHDAALASVGGGEKIYDYRYALNGFAALLTKAQVAALERRPDVLQVWADELRQPATDNTPTFLGLNAPGGLWDLDVTGEDVVIGVIDTGIWPEHPSFSDQVDFADRPGNSGKRTRAYGPPPADWYGGCQSGEQISQDDCNFKLVGAKSFKDGFTNHDINISGDYLSARDADGHGTHTASTAGGNGGVPADTFGISRGTVSGMAPRARIAAYKVCWADAGCWSSDSAAAVDQAVADGVDVINYSIGGGASLSGADDIAFLFAADAGIFVATSAGNAGPGASTMGGPASVPWITAVGASTHSRAFISDITLSGPGSPPAGVWGGSITQGIDNYNLVDAEEIADAAGDTSGMCLNPFLPGTFMPDYAVLCNQYNFGVARMERVANVAAGGGGAVIFHNSAAVSMTPTDNHVLPTVHMLNDVGQPLKDYLVANPSGVTVSFTAGQSKYSPADPRVKPNVTASFSSRGPNPAAEDLIKPDVTAPGVSILAGNSPVSFLGAQNQLFQAIMGTSMSSPHVAGLFGLLKEAHPSWSAAMAKSALMTTAYQDVKKEDGVTPADPFDMGAGHVNPNPAVDPGLVYDAGFLDYLAFLCGATSGVVSQGTCDFLTSIGYSFDASDLNLASIGIAELPGSQTIVRTVTNVGLAGTYNVTVDGLSGITAAVSPSSLTLAAGKSATYHVTFTNVTAPVNQWAFGSLTWSDGSHAVRSPIAIRPTLFSAPAQVSGTGVEGALSFDVIFGYDGAYTAAAHGLVPATVTSGNVLQDPDQEFDPDDGYSNLHQFNLSGAAHFRIAMPPEATEEGADLDIFVYNPGGTLAAASTNGGTDELIDISEPADGTWDVYVHGWLTPGGDSDYDMYTWALSAAPGGNLSIDSAPTSATLGATGTIDVSWTGATASQWHLGAVSHTGPGGLMGLTLVDVDNR